MDASAFFSAEELAAWSWQREWFHQIYFTGLGLKMFFLLAVPLAGIHLALRRRAEGVAGWLYGRPWLSALGRRVRPLRGVIRVFERLGQGRHQDVEARQWLVDILVPVLFFLLWTALILPMDFFAGYIVDHEVGLSNTPLSLWWSDWIKDLALTLIFAGFLGLGLFGLARRLARTWWLWLWGATVGVLLLWSLLSPYRARIFHDFEPLPEGELRASIVEIMRRAGLEVERVETVDTSRRSKAANAYIMGEGPTKRVVLADNLVDRFHPREIVVAVGHEAGHHLHEHPTRTWLVTSAAALLFLLLVRLLLWRAPRIRFLGLKPHADPAVLPLVLLVLQLLFLANNPLSGYLDRQEERKADLEALRLTGDPVGYCSLLIRLNRLNQSDPDPPDWVVWYFKHHPKTAERLKTGFAWAREHGFRIGRGAIPLTTPNGELGMRNEE